jgi:outer membrane protein TolC
MKLAMTRAGTRAMSLALACVLVSPLGAQNPPVQTVPSQIPTPVPAPGDQPYSGPLPQSGGRIPDVSYGIGFLGDYHPGSVSAFDPKNSPRIHDLIRAGIIYLSLQDAIALALENNLDLQWQRYTVQIAATDTLRARGGGLLRGIALAANEPPAGLGGPGEPLLNSAASGATPQSTIQANVSDTQFIVEATDNLNTTGTLPFSSGPSIPQFDPSLNAQFLAQHATTPENSTVITGTPALVQNTFSENVGYTQGFSPGTQVTAGWDNLRTDSNSVRNLLNPFYNSSFGVTVTQPLMRGFGIELNRRFIRIGKLTEKLSEHVFRYQASITVGGVVRLYDDLVSLNEDLKVKQETLTTAQRLTEDNRNKVEQGTLAPVELTRALAQVAAARQDLVNSEGFVRQQELILKSVLVRDLASDPAVHDARIVPTDPLNVAPAPEYTREQLVQTALVFRPDYLAAQSQLDITQVTLKGTRNELRPELDLVANMSNSGLAGSASSIFSVTPGSVAPGPNTILGYGDGYGTTLAQILKRDYPTYSIGLNLTLPLRNRAAQADLARDELTVRQTQVRTKQLENTVRVQVEDALIALERTKSAYEAAADSRKLQEQSLELEQERFNVGLSTNFLVIQYQSYVAQARSSEVAALGAYAKARTQLDSAMGIILRANGITLPIAYQGAIERTSAPAVK